MKDFDSFCCPGWLVGLPVVSVQGPQRSWRRLRRGSTEERVRRKMTEGNESPKKIRSLAWPLPQVTNSQVSWDESTVEDVLNCVRLDTAMRTQVVWVGSNSFLV
jgi:hypothetical protein